MKSILISIKPEWTAKILNGDKTVEIRKTMPKCDLPIDVYIYCTKGDYIGRISKKYVGKVVAMFTLNKVEEISWQMGVYELEQQWFSDFLDKCCLGFSELKNYLNRKNGYAWHISDLVIFDKPKELGDFYKVGYLDYINPCEHPRYPETYEDFHKCVIEVAKHKFKLTKAPQSWCYVE